MTDKEHFIESCRFAKVVSTPVGDAILVQGEVINVSSRNEGVVDWLVSALRQAGDCSPTPVVGSQKSNMGACEIGA